MLGEDIRFLKLSLGELHSIGESPFSGAFVFVMIIPPLAFLGAFAYRKREERLSGRADQLRFAKAGREASRRLKQAKKLLSQGNAESYHAEISGALLLYLGDKLHLSKALLTIDDAARILEQRGVGSDTISALRSCIERAEYARFAPAADTQEARTEILDAAATVINDIERSFSKRP